MEECQEQVQNVELLDIHEVKVDKKQRIRITSGKNVEELKESIDELGLFHPILVNKDHELIAGYRRLKACKKLGWNMIPAFVKPDLSEIDEINIELQENIKRKNLSPYEVDIALAKLKRIYEALYPETAHLAHVKSAKNEKQKKKSKITQEHKRERYINEETPESEAAKPNARFTKVASQFSNYSERTLRDRIQVGNAILDKKFDDKTVNLFKNGKISHTEMLTKDRKRRKIEKTLNRAKRTRTNKKNGTQPQIESSVKWCKDCSNATLSFCPECGKQVINCNKGYSLLKKLDSTTCSDFSS